MNSLPSSAVLKFRYQYLKASGDALDVGISADGGANWSPVSSVANCSGSSGPYVAHGCNAIVNLSSFLPASGDVMLRWRYHDSDALPWNWYAQIDDVRIGQCEPMAGGLISGQVKDAVTGKPLIGATIADDLGGTVKTIENPADANLPPGFYTLFASVGERSLTAGDWHYADSTSHVNVANNATVSRNFKLDAGRLIASPAAVSVSAAVDERGTAKLTLKNTGNVALHFKLLESAMPPPVSTAAHAGSLGSQPLRRLDGQPRISLSTCGGGYSFCPASPRLFVGARAAGSAPGSIVSSFDPGLSGVYGLGVDRESGLLWVGSIAANDSGGDGLDHEFKSDGTATGRIMDVSAFSPGGVMADMAYDYNTGLLWQIGVIGNHFCLFALDPSEAVSVNHEICPTTNSYEFGLAYDPATDSWFAGDFNNNTIYHFDSAGKLIDAKTVGIKIIGLTYNPSSGHLFALTTLGAHDVFVLDSRNNYQVLGSFDISGLNGGAGAGLGHDCNGNLWVTDLKHAKVYEVRSGETGWCDFRDVSWLSEAPAVGTIAPGATAEITLSFVGSEQEAGTVSKAAVLLRTDMPYRQGTLVVPVTIAWEEAPDSPPVASDAQISTKEGQSVSGQLKATDPDGDPLTYELVAQPKHGEVSLDDASSGAFTYSPASGYTGTDSFTFKASDGQLDSNVATISITVKAQSHSSSGGGGGAIGWSVLCSFLSLMVLMLVFSRRKARLSRNGRSD